MSPPFEKHVPSLYQPLFNKLIAKLGCLSRFSSSCQEYPPFMILDGHKIGWNLDIYYIGSIAMGSEVVHK
jgi:predicted ATP-grasp superfamily ATP-dependent carboligase